MSDRFNDYARKVVGALRGAFVRAEADLSPDTLQKKVRAASLMKIPNIVVLGEREQASESVSLRRRGRKEQQALSLNELVSVLRREILERENNA